MAAHSLKKGLGTSFPAVALGVLFLVSPHAAHAATVTWDGGGADSNWSTCANWSGNTCPTSSDVATFNNTSTKDSVIDSSFAGSVAGMAIASTYTGTITQARDVTVGTSGYTQAGGTVNQGTFALNGSYFGDFAITGGVLNAGVGTSTYRADFTVGPGATYTASSTRVVDFVGTSDSVLTCSGNFPGLVGLDNSLTGTVSIATGCAATTTANVSSGTGLTVNGTLTAQGTTLSLYTLTINAGGTLNFAGATTTLTGNFTKASGSTFDSSSVLVLNTDLSSSVTCAETLPNPIKPSKSTGRSLTISANCSVTTVANADSGTALIVNGSLTAQGDTLGLYSLTINSGATVTFGGATTTLTGNFTKASGSTFDSSSVLKLSSNAASTITCAETLPNEIQFAKMSGAAVTVSANCSVTTVANADSGTALIVNGSLTAQGDTLGLYSLTINSGATVTFGGATTTLTGNFTKASGSTFDSSSAIAFTSTTASVLSCSETLPNVVSVAKSTTAALTVGAGCTITTTANSNSRTSLTVNGTVTAPGTTLTLYALTVAAGGTLNFSGATTTLEANFTKSSSGAFNSSSILELTTATASTITCTEALPNHLHLTKGNGAAVTVSDGCEVALAQNESNGVITKINGTLYLNGHSYTTSQSLTVFSGGTLKLNGDESFTTPVLKDGSTVAYAGSGSYALLKAGSLYSNLSITGSGTYATSSDITIARNFSQTNGTFTHTGTLSFTGTSTSYYATTSAGTHLGNVTVNGSGLTLVLGGSGLALSGDLTLTSGTLDASDSGCSSVSCPIRLAGDWSNSGTFSARTGTVTLDGTAQSLSGATAFYNLAKTVSAADTLTFPANQTQTVTGTLTLAGAAGNLLSLRSSSAGTQWGLDPSGTRTLSYLDVQDSNNTDATPISLSAETNTDSGDNTNWVFVAAAPSGGGIPHEVIISCTPGTDTATVTYVLAHDCADAGPTDTTATTTGAAAAPAPAGASEDELRARIATLRALIASLIARSTGAPPFVQDLSLGSRGEDVRQLQKYLNGAGFTVSAAGPGSPGYETEYFGRATREALARFQRAHGITPAVGYFGQKTRAAISP